MNQAGFLCGICREGALKMAFASSRASLSVIYICLYIQSLKAETIVKGCALKSPPIRDELFSKLNGQPTGNS